MNEYIVLDYDVHYRLQSRQGSFLHACKKACGKEQETH